MRRKIEARLDDHVAPATPVHGMAEIVSHHLGELQSLAHRLTDRINRLMSDVVANESATDGDVYRAVGRFEAFVDNSPCYIGDWSAVEHRNPTNRLSGRPWR